MAEKETGRRLRARILDCLAVGPRTAAELAAALGVTPSTLSYHLGVLRERERIVFTADGPKRIYSLRPGRASEPARREPRECGSGLIRIHRVAALDGFDARSLAQPLLVFRSRDELRQAMATGMLEGDPLPAELKVLLQAIESALGIRPEADVIFAGGAFRVL